MDPAKFNLGVASQVQDNSNQQQPVQQASSQEQQPQPHAQQQQQQLQQQAQQTQQQPQQILPGNTGNEPSALGGAPNQGQMLALNYSNGIGLPSGIMNSGSLSHPGQVPLLVGATPFQQQLSALQGTSNSAGGSAGGSTVQQLQDQQQQQQQGQQQQIQIQQQQQQPSTANPPILQQQQLSQPTQAEALQNQAQQIKSRTDQTHALPQQETRPAPLPTQATIGTPQQDGSLLQNAATAMAGFNQNAMLAAAMHGNMGFNLQQLQQLQLAQHLITAGLPPNLAFGAMQQPGASVMNNPLMLAGLANPMMAQFGALGGMAAATNPMASLAMNGTNPATPPGLGFLGMNGMAAANPATSTNPIIAAGLGALKQDNKATAPTANTIPKQPQPDWAEPFAGKGKKEPPFPLKLHQILSNPEFQECICWNPHGRSWRILKPPVFEQLVIPLYFRHAKYASFMRQVNGWGFKRIVSGNDHNSYFHELFLRDYPQLCLKMKRIRKGEKTADDDSDGDEKGVPKDLKEEEDATKSNTEHVFQGKEESKSEESGPEAILPRDVPSVADTDNAQTLASLGLSTGSTGLATAAPGFSALASLQGQLKNGNNVSTQSSAVPNASSNSGGALEQPQYQSAPTPGMPVPPAQNIVAPNVSFIKLQEALQSQQQQQSSQASTPSALNLTNLNFLQGPMGGTLAAQLQAATQAPSRTDNSIEDGLLSSRQTNGSGSLEVPPKLPEQTEVQESNAANV